VEILSRSVREVAKFGRWVRRMSARYLIGYLPGVARRYQRFRYRNWVQNLDPNWLSSARRPDFIVIGAPKCGTSWLLSALNQHPNIRMPPREVEYFSLHLDYPVAWYLEHFANLAGGPEPCGTTYIVGEKSARYCSMPQSHIERVRELMPDVRIVLMARDPVARHWAHAKRHFGKRRYRHPEQAILDVPRRKLFAFFEETRPLGEFSKIITNWTSVFPPSQLLVISQEATLKSPRETFDAVLEFIGAPTDYDPAAITYLSRQTNRGPQVEMPAEVAAFLETMFAAERTWLRNLFGERAFLHVS
jgi:hypothetical protein